MKYSLTTLCGSHRVELPEGRSFMGSDSRNAIAVRPETGASAKQFETWQEPDGCWLRDCYSGVPTYVNGQPISVIKLEPGDIIQVGSLQMRFEQEGVATPSKPVSRRITGNIPVTSVPHTSSVAVRLSNQTPEHSPPPPDSANYSNLSARTTRSVPTMRTPPSDAPTTHLPWAMPTRKSTPVSIKPTTETSTVRPGAAQQNTGSVPTNPAAPPITPALPDGTAAALMRQTFATQPAAPVASSSPNVPEFGPPSQGNSSSASAYEVPPASNNIVKFPSLDQSEFGLPRQNTAETTPSATPHETSDTIRTSTITRINHPGRDWENLPRTKPKFGRWLMASAAMFCLGGPIIAHFQSNGRSTEVIRSYLPNFLKPQEFAPATIEASESRPTTQVITTAPTTAESEVSDLLDPEHFSVMDNFVPSSLSSIMSVRGEELYSGYQSIQRGPEITAWLTSFTPALNYTAADITHFTVLNSGDRSLLPTVVISLKNKISVDQILTSEVTYHKQPITHQKYRGFKITDGANQVSVVIERGPRTYVHCDERTLNGSDPQSSKMLVKQFHPCLFKRDFSIVQVGTFPLADLSGSSVKAVSVKIGANHSIGLMLPLGPAGLNPEKTDNGTQSTFDNWRRQSVFNFGNIIREGVPGFSGLRAQINDKNSVIRYLDSNWIRANQRKKGK